MYFLFTKGGHPIWDRKNDTREAFIAKLTGDY
jgi:hypothetical protein